MDTMASVLTVYIRDYPEQTIAVAVAAPGSDLRLSILGDRVFHAASTMKVPVMMELFRRVESGDVSLEDSLLVKNEFASIVDGSHFSIEDDSDDVIYGRLGSYMSLRELNHSMITVSSNLATNLLIDHLGAESIQRHAESVGVKTMRVLRGVEDIKAFRQGLSNTATANDLATLMLELLESSERGDESSLEMVKVLAEQKFNDLIPAGLPPDYTVAHKTGWITGIRHDAAIVYPPASPPYVLVVLTEGFEDQVRAVQVIRDIARIVDSSISESSRWGLQNLS